RMSATVPLGTESTVSPVAGLRTGMVSLLSESINSLATSNFAIESSVWFQNFKNNHVHRWLSRIGGETGIEIDDSTNTKARLGKSWASGIKTSWSKCPVPLGVSGTYGLLEMCLSSCFPKFEGQFRDLVAACEPNPLMLLHILNHLLQGLRTTR